MESAWKRTTTTKNKTKNVRKETVTKPGVQIIERRNKQKHQEFTNQFEGLV